MPSDENLTPEEKLLRVIQGVDQEKDSTASMKAEEAREPRSEAPPSTSGPTADAGQAPQSEPEIPEKEDVPEEPQEPLVAKETEAEMPPEEEPPVPVQAEQQEETEDDLKPEEGPAVEQDSEEGKEARPKLKLATASAGTPEAEIEEGTPEGEEPETSAEDDDPAAVAAASSAASDPLVVAPGVKYEERRTGFSTSNRCLMAVVILILALVGFEIWANITAKPMLPPTDTGSPEMREMRHSELEPIEKILAEVAKKPIFPPDGEDNGSDERKVSKPKSIDYVRKHIKLAGIADISEDEREAIVMDKGVGKVHFLRVGDIMLANDVRFKVTRIESNKAVITDGSGEMELQ